MKKKVLSLVLATAMAVSMLAGCGNNQQAAAPAESAPASTQAAAPAESAPAEKEAVEQVTLNLAYRPN